MKKLLLIINPNAGMKRANKYLTDILLLFLKYGYTTEVRLTMGRGDGYDIARECSCGCDLVVCIGGDGTFNETVGGLIDSGCKVALGYIPAGSTNDFGSGLGLSKRILQAAEDIMTGTVRMIDIGKFNDRYFSYTASFGVFTKVSYTTSQSIKNALGHLAYVLEGIKELSSIRSEHIKIRVNGDIIEDDYIFGAICNSTSLGGVLTLSPDVVDLSDGMFEILLIRMPKNIIELNAIIFALNNKDYSSTDMIYFCSASSAQIEADKTVSWTLDGEYMEGSNVISMENIHDAVNLIVPAR
ncbi:MAG: diacylglycerol kinase family lipid kinase [Clostridia bacterium]|nr:diacylglycerol kinase family lipid kinase [Clostridia bacterium]